MEFSLPEQIRNEDDGFSFQCSCDPEGKLGNATYISFEGDILGDGETETCSNCGTKYEYRVSIRQYLSAKTKDGVESCLEVE